MKKILYCLICCCMFCLTACGDKLPYPYEDMKDKVVKVEIVILNSDSSKEFLKELTDEEVDEFLIKLSEIKFKNSVGDPSASLGYVFAIYYNDNYSELLSSNGSSIYNSQDKLTGGRNIYCSKEDFNDLLSNFIEIEQ